MNALSVYDDRWIKTVIWLYGDKVNTNFPGLNVPQDLRIYITCISKKSISKAEFATIVLNM